MYEIYALEYEEEKMPNVSTGKIETVAVLMDKNLVHSPLFSGLGYVVINPVLTLEVNKAGSLEFSLTPSHPLYNRLHKLRTIITVNENGKEIWRGRILESKTDFYKNKNIFCEGALAFLNDIMLTLPKKFATKGALLDDYMNYVCDAYNARCSLYRKITFGGCNFCALANDENAINGSTKIYVNRDASTASDSAISEDSAENDGYVSAFSALIEIPTNIYGGRFKIFYKDTGIDLVYVYTDTAFVSGDNDRYISDSNGTVIDSFVKSYQTIRFGSNLLDFEECLNASEVYTEILPFGAKPENESSRLNLKKLCGGKLYPDVTNRGSIVSEEGLEQFGRIMKVAIYDNVGSRRQLYQKAKKALQNAVGEAVSITANAVDLHMLDVDTDKLDIGDAVRVISEPHNIDAMFFISKISLDMCNPNNNKYTLGADFTSISSRDAAKTTKTSFLEERITKLEKGAVNNADE